MTQRRTYQIFAARLDDAHQGWVHLHDPSLPTRCVVKITNPANQKSIYCEALQMEKNYLDSYNRKGGKRVLIADPANSISICRFHRSVLGDIQTKTNVALEVKRCNHLWGQIHACIDHPQIVIWLATKLAIVSVALGVTGLALGAISLGLCRTGIAVGLLGIALLGFGLFWPRGRR